MHTGFTLMHNTDVPSFIELAQHDSVIHCNVTMALNIGSTILPCLIILQNSW